MTRNPLPADIAALVKRRDRGLCVRCGRPAASIHHRQPRGMGGTRDPRIHSPANLVCLCGTGTTGCHGWIEHHRSEARATGWLVSRWADPADVPIRVAGRLVWLDDHGTHTPPMEGITHA